MRVCVIAAALIVSGCQYNPFAHEFTRAKPRESSIVGEYVPDEETTERIAKSLGVTVSRAAAVTIKSDHMFLATELPKCWIEQSFHCAPGTETWAGTWSLRQNQKWWAVQLHIKSRDGRTTSYGMSAMLRGEAPPYLLHLTIGDPDSGDALAFARREPRSNSALHRTLNRAALAPSALLFSVRFNAGER